MLKYLEMILGAQMGHFYDNEYMSKLIHCWQQVMKDEVKCKAVLEEPILGKYKVYVCAHSVYANMGGDFSDFKDIDFFRTCIRRVTNTRSGSFVCRTLKDAQIILKVAGYENHGVYEIVVPKELIVQSKEGYLSFLPNCKLQFENILAVHLVDAWTSAIPKESVRIQNPGIDSNNIATNALSPKK